MKVKVRYFLMGILIASLLMSVSLGQGFLEDIRVSLNSVKLKVNGENVKADTILYEGTTYVPLRATAEMLDKEVSWDKASNTAEIKDKNLKEAKNSKAFNEEDLVPINQVKEYRVESSTTSQDYRIKVMEVHRGEEAEKILKKEDFKEAFPDKKDEFELLLVKLKSEIIGKDGRPSPKINQYGILVMDIFTLDGESYSSPFITRSSKNLNPNEEYRVLLVKKDETKPILGVSSIYKPFAGNNIYFKLYE